MYGKEQYAYCMLLKISTSVFLKCKNKYWTGSLCTPKTYARINLNSPQINFENCNLVTHVECTYYSGNSATITVNQTPIQTLTL